MLLFWYGSGDDDDDDANELLDNSPKAYSCVEPDISLSLGSREREPTD